MSIYTETIGRGEEVVLLHGWGFNSSIMQPLAKKLSKTYRVTLIDLPGFGRSQIINNYNLGNLAISVVPYIPDNSILIGWSLGGLLALTLANKFSHKIKKIITISTNPCFIAKHEWPGISFQLFSEFEKMLIINPLMALQRFALLQVKGATDKNRNYAIVKKIISWEKTPSMEALVNGLNILKNTDLRESLKTNTYPLLCIFANTDTLVPIAVSTHVVGLNTLIKIKIIKNAAHMPLLFNLTELARYIIHFIQDNP